MARGNAKSAAKSHETVTVDELEQKL
jgi:hypothetical protein